MRINLYAQNRHVVVWDGVPLSGFAEGDYIQIKADGGGATRTHGGDGPSMNLTTPQGGQITLSLQPTSPAIGTLYKLRDQQVKNPRLFNISVVTGVEEVIAANGCAYADLPQFQTGGPTMQARQFIAECLEIKLDLSATEAISGGAIGGLI